MDTRTFIQFIDITFPVFGGIFCLLYCHRYIVAPAEGKHPEYDEQHEKCKRIMEPGAWIMIVGGAAFAMFRFLSMM